MFDLRLTGSDYRTRLRFVSLSKESTKVSTHQLMSTAVTQMSDV